MKTNMKPTTTKRQPLTHLRIDADLDQAVKARARAEGRTITNFINYVLRQYLGLNKDK